MPSDGTLLRPRRDRPAEEALQGSLRIDGAAVLRSPVLMCVKNWDYLEPRDRIAHGVTPQLTDFYCDPVPKHDAFNRDFKSADAASALSDQ